MNTLEISQSMFEAGCSWARIREFLLAHKKQPYLWKRFCDAVQAELLESKASHISAKAVWERMRRSASKEMGSEFALDNNLHSLYARAFVSRYPMYREIFEFRELKKVA